MAKVLVVEDEPGLLEILADVLRGVGHEVTLARDGVEGLELARSAKPDLVVTDHMMARKSGADLIRDLRRDPALAELPVVLMSAGMPPEEERRAATRFLEKPFTPADFEQAVREALTGTGKAPAMPAAQVSSLREQMLSWVSHEIKSPLSAAMTAVPLATRALRAGDAAQVEKRHEMIARQLRRMDELVTSILDAAQIEDGKLRLQLERVSLDEFVADAAAFWREIQPDHDITVSGKTWLTLDIDRERIRQILDNLISNAVKYGGSAKLVAVSIASDASTVSISVRDWGPGVPADELDDIFDRFHRVAGQAGRGHGLGLYIAAALARLHGGSLRVESQVGAGSTFTLALPRERGVEC